MAGSYYCSSQTNHSLLTDLVRSERLHASLTCAHASFLGNTLLCFVFFFFFFFLFCLFFFFSSRRRHTRSDRDWSSDVCSSDLSSRLSILSLIVFFILGAFLLSRVDEKKGIENAQENSKIGRASCRERV